MTRRGVALVDDDLTGAARLGAVTSVISWRHRPHHLPASRPRSATVRSRPASTWRHDPLKRVTGSTRRVTVTTPEGALDLVVARLGLALDLDRVAGDLDLLGEGHDGRPRSSAICTGVCGVASDDSVGPG